MAMSIPKIVSFGFGTNTASNARERTLCWLFRTERASMRLSRLKNGETEIND